MTAQAQLPLRERCSRFLHQPATDIAVIVLIVLSVALLLVEYSYAWDEDTLRWMDHMGQAISAIFAVELSLRYWVARKKSRFFRRYWPDILAVAPLLRPFRLFRLLRLLRLFRLGLLLSRRVTLFRGVFRINMYEVWVLGVITLILVVGSSVLAYLFEGSTTREFSTLQSSFWWALHSLVAAEPVGAMPQTLAGRILLVGVMLSGMTMFAVFTGVVSATMIDRLSGREEVWEMDVDELEGHIVICGWNAGVSALVAEIAEDRHLRGVPVVLVNELEAPPDLSSTGLPAELFYWIRGDHTKLDVLQRAGVERAAKAVVMVDLLRETAHPDDRDARTVLAALTLERLNPKIFCTVELLDAANESHLRVAGVEAIVMQNDLTGRVLAAACRHPQLVHVVMELLTLKKGQTIYHLQGPERPASFGQIMESIKASDDELVIGVQREGSAARINPPLDLMVSPEDSLIVIGTKGGVRRLSLPPER